MTKIEHVPTPVRTLLERAERRERFEHPPADYRVPEHIQANSEKFYDNVIQPTKNAFEDDRWFEHHWWWTGKTRADGQMFIYCRSLPIPVQRFIWLLRRGPVPEDLFARPICGEKKCVNPYHLRLKERGVRNRKLSPRQLSEIRYLYYHTEPGHKASKLARMFRVSERYIYHILQMPDA